MMLALATNIRLGWKSLLRGKHSSEFVWSVSDDEKKFYGIDAGSSKQKSNFKMKFQSGGGKLQVPTIKMEQLNNNCFDRTYNRRHCSKTFFSSSPTLQTNTLVCTPIAKHFQHKLIILGKDRGS
jgi:hypothetical protein